ncbi:MAG: hypothetical protein Q4Q23_05175 [Methanobacteriaceae archaeon]|nr:hypothetical protein [Methanobacteriaceae archaeon]
MDNAVTPIKKSIIVFNPVFFIYVVYTVGIILNISVLIGISNIVVINTGILLFSRIIAVLSSFLKDGKFF